jgi:hypothetical protein
MLLAIKIMEDVHERISWLCVRYFEFGEKSQQAAFPIKDLASLDEDLPDSVETEDPRVGIVRCYSECGGSLANPDSEHSDHAKALRVSIESIPSGFIRALVLHPYKNRPTAIEYNVLKAVSTVNAKDVKKLKARVAELENPRFSGGSLSICTFEHYGSLNMCIILFLQN